MIILKIFLMCILVLIAYQDLKSRAVYWFLFPILIGLLGVLHYENVLQMHFITSIAINISVVCLILLVLYLYTVLRIKRPFFQEVFGLGDALYFIALAIAFPTITFTIVFVFSLFFSGFVWLLFKKNSKHTTIPLAGYMGLFLILMFIGDWSKNIIDLYLI